MSDPTPPGGAPHEAPAPAHAAAPTTARDGAPGAVANVAAETSTGSRVHVAPDALPTAISLPPRRGALLWLVPFAAVLVAAYAGWHAWQERGIRIAVSFEQGHGIAPGDPVKHRGIVVGSVRDVALTPGADAVVVTLSMRREADALARAGSRFWLVRPEIGLRRIAGLDTIVGARYVEVLPPADPGLPRALQTTFVGLDAAPIVTERRPGNLSIVVELSRRGSLAPGTPVIYRQVQVGVVESVDLASDACSVECAVHIDAPYAALVRERTRFWDAGGIEVGVGLKGVTAAVDSPETLLRGGLALATPPDAGAAAVDGARFRADERAEEQWLRWRPQVVIGSALLPPGVPEPRTVTVALSWTEGSIFARDKSRAGWALPTRRGLLAPAWVVAAPKGAHDGSIALAIDGDAAAWPPGSIAGNAFVLLLDIPGSAAGTERLRSPAGPEDCAIMTGLARPVALAPGRLRVEETGWRVDPGVPLDEALDGAVVAARSDGAVIGLLERSRGDSWFVRPLPAVVVAAVEESTTAPATDATK